MIVIYMTELINMGIDNLKIGERKEIPKIVPKLVEIKSYTSAFYEGNECLVFKVKHPDIEELIEIKNIKVLDMFGKLRVQGIWIGTDDKGLLPYNCNLAILMRSAEATEIKELIGKKVMTDIFNFNNPILVFKGYK